MYNIIVNHDTRYKTGIYDRHGEYHVPWVDQFLYSPHGK